MLILNHTLVHILYSIMQRKFFELTHYFYKLKKKKSENWEQHIREKHIYNTCGAHSNKKIEIYSVKFRKYTVHSTMY